MIIVRPVFLLLLVIVIVVAAVVAALVARYSRGAGVTMTAAERQRALADRRRAIDEADRALAAWKRDRSEANLAALDAANARLRQASEAIRPDERPPAPAKDDPIEQIRRLGELRDQRVLTDEEFEAKKRELLGKIT